MVRDEQSKIVNNYYELENRYKEILSENKWIKNEILDLRKNKTQLKSNYESTLNMPYNKSSLGVADISTEHKSTSSYYTPSRDVDLKIGQRFEESNINVMLSDQKSEMKRDS